MSALVVRPRALAAPVAALVVLLAAGAAVAVEPKAVVAAPLLLVGVYALVRPDVVFVVLLAGKPVVDYFVRHQIGGVSLGQAWGGALLLTAAVFLVVHRGERLSWSAYRTPLVLAVAYPLLTFTRGQRGDAVVNELRLLSWLAVVVVVEQIATSAAGQRRVVRLGLVMALLLCVVIAFMEHTNQYGRAYYASTLAFSQLDVMQPAGVSAFAVYCSALAIVPLVAGRRSIAPLLLYAGLGAGVVLSLVRTSFFAFLVVLGGVVARGIYLRRGSIVAVGAVVVGSIAVVLVTYQHVISSRLVHASGRVSFWRPVLDGTLAHPLSILVGHGPTYSFTVIQQALNEAIWSHNDFVDLFGTGGVVLLGADIALVLWLFASALSLARDQGQSERARDIGWLAVLVCCAFVVIAMFNDAVFASPTVAVGVLIGLVRGMGRTPGATLVD